MQFQDSHGNRMYGAWKPWLRRLSRQAVYALVVVFGYFCIFAVTQVDLTTQVKGILPLGNGGTGQSSFSAGVLRSSGSAISSGELSGDATTSASNVVTVGKINGTSVPTNAAADQVLVTTSSATGAWKSMTDTSDGSHAVTYNTTTHAWGSVAILSGNFADNETPTGSCPTTSLTLAHTPSPAGSLSLYYNGQLLVAGGADFTLATATITLTSSCPTGSVFRANYRY